MNEDQVTGEAEALAELEANLAAVDPEAQTEEVAQVDPNVEIGNQVYNRLREETQAAWEAQQEAERQANIEAQRQAAEAPIDYDDYPEGVPIEVVEQRAAQRTMRIIQVQQTVHDEVDGVINSYKEKFGDVPAAVTNTIKAALRQVDPMQMRQGLGTEAARYYIAEAIEKGQYIPVAKKTTTTPPGGGSRQMAPAGKGVDPSRSQEAEVFANYFPELKETDVKEIFSR